MKPLSYRSRLRLKRLAECILPALLLIVLLIVGVVIYLGRYVVYTADGAYLSFLHEPQTDSQTVSDPGTDFKPVKIGPAGVAVRPQTDAVTTPAAEQAEDTPIRGVYLSYADLQDTQACLDTIHSADGCNTVLLALKSNAGFFYFDSPLSLSPAPNVDLQAVNAMVRKLSAEGYHLIARIPAFIDTAYGLEHMSSSLQLSNGALWMDADGYYWLNAASDDAQQYLRSLTLELAALGIDEIAYSDFTMPVSDHIAYSEPDAEARTQTLATVASRLVDLGAENGFSVSFCDPTEDCPTPSADGHILLSGQDGPAAASAEETYQKWIRDAQSLIFLTDSRDTRFQPYGILRSSSEE